MSLISLHHISWNRPDGSNLFHDITFSCSHEKTGLTGPNGVGKSVLAAIISGSRMPAAGSVQCTGSIGLLPQNYLNYRSCTVSGFLGIADEIAALHRVAAGYGTAADFDLLENRWDIEQRAEAALYKTGIGYIGLDRQFDSLSGGEQVRCAFASLLLQQPAFLLLDEPTNHLDTSMREFVYDMVQKWNGGLMVISHDRHLLRLMERIIELRPGEARIYGGNYDSYAEQRQLEINALQSDVAEAEKGLAVRMRERRQAMQRQEARTRSAAKSSADAAIPKIMMNTRIGWGEATASKMKNLHTARVTEAQAQLDDARAALPKDRFIRIDAGGMAAPPAKNIIIMEELNYSFGGGRMIWPRNLNFHLRGSSRIHLRGANGSGKSTLLSLITGRLQPSVGTIRTLAAPVSLLDQNVSLLDDSQSVLANVTRYANGAVSESELRIRLARFLFFNDDVFKPAGVLSGGERMRAGMACLFASHFNPALLLLDEPVNNLDLGSVEQLAGMLHGYPGPLIVISHDTDFVADIGITELWDLETVSH